MKFKDVDDVLDEIRNASNFRQMENITISTVDRLRDTHWCNTDDLVLAYNDLQNPDLDRVVVFFQLPFSIRLPDKWIKVRSEYGNPYIRFRPIQTGRDSAELTWRTQALMSYQLWERRRQLYIPYLEALNNPKGIVKTRLKSSGFLNAVEFEQDLVKRLRLQTTQVLRDFIPTYQVICKDAFAYVPDRISHFFMMVKRGKVIVSDMITSSMTTQGKCPPPAPDYSRNFTALRNRLKTPWRPSIYETYLLEAARQIELGASNLAIVQIVMILDWFANEIIEDHLLRKMKSALDYSPRVYELTYEYLWEDGRERIVSGTEEKYLRYFPAIGISLTPILVGDLREMIKHRNKIVHRSQADPIDSALALRALDAGMSIIRHCMDCLLAKNRRPANKPTAETKTDLIPTDEDITESQSTAQARRAGSVVLPQS